MDWYKSRDWCQRNGMQLTTLKRPTEVEAVVAELKNLGFSMSKAAFKVS
jgi:hypothetical protein